MTRNSDDVAQIQQLKEFESLRPHNIELHIKLQPCTVPHKMGKRGFAMRSESNDAPCHANRYLVGGEFFSRAIPELICNLLGRVRPGKPVRMSRMAQRLDLAQFFQALVILIKRLKFQLVGPFAGREYFGKSDGSITGCFQERQENGAREKLVL